VPRQREIETNPRKERVPLGAARRKLTARNAAFEDRGKVGRWVNDRDSRLQDALAAGYQHVITDEGVTVGDVGDGNTSTDSRISRVVGTDRSGRPLRAYLMEIDRELYEEDQTSKQAEIDEVDAVIQRGQLDRQANDGRYVPDHSIRIDQTLETHKPS